MWAGVACGAVLAVAGGFAVEGAMDTAGAQSGFTVSAEQLRTNQKISQAAVRRSNRSLNYLAPIRTAATDNADTGRDGVKPLNQIPGSGQGWTTGQIANSAITGAKLGNGAVTNEKLGPEAVTGAKIAGGTITAANIAPGQVVKGNGSFLSSHQVLATGATDTPILAMPGVGQLLASCAAGVTTVSFLNQAGAAVEVSLGRQRRHRPDPAVCGAGERDGHDWHRLHRHERARADLPGRLRRCGQRPTGDDGRDQRRAFGHELRPDRFGGDDRLITAHRSPSAADEGERWPLGSRLNP
jgi:hypothetical protein